MPRPARGTGRPFIFRACRGGWLAGPEGKPGMGGGALSHDAGNLRRQRVCAWEDCREGVLRLGVCLLGKACGVVWSANLFI